MHRGVPGTKRSIIPEFWGLIPLFPTTQNTRRYKKVLGILLFMLVTITVAILSFCIGYCKRRLNWFGPDSFLLPMSTILVLILLGLLRIQKGVIWWQIVIIFVIGISCYLSGNSRASRRIVEKERLREEEKQNEHERLGNNS